MRNNKFGQNFIKQWIFITENAERFQFKRIYSFMQDQSIFIAILQGFNGTKWLFEKGNFRELQKKKELAAYRHIKKPDAEYRTRYPIYDKQLAKYEVAINETIINSKIYRFKQMPEKRKDTVIIHYYLNGKYAAHSVFPTWQYALEHCTYLT